jgi:hypothetical protein
MTSPVTSSQTDSPHQAQRRKTTQEETCAAVASKTGSQAPCVGMHLSSVVGGAALVRASCPRGVIGWTVQGRLTGRIGDLVGRVAKPLGGSALSALGHVAGGCLHSAWPRCLEAPRLDTGEAADEKTSPTVCCHHCVLSLGEVGIVCASFTRQRWWTWCAG